MSASERDVPVASPVPGVVAGVSMRELLAACAAADAVSLPPRVPPAEVAVVEEPRKAA
ncbi:MULTISPECIES: hypothetical protein [unclassified Streptomyces]|uniref:hypothetical protein n=1 Tax=unclassified Streptomyces TaxID=2593676 RepID=UPI002E0E5D23|nr:hypothetical protein OG324_30040 [Streptomyces sp. NBC_01236]